MNRDARHPIPPSHPDPASGPRAGFEIVTVADRRSRWSLKLSLVAIVTSRSADPPPDLVQSTHAPTDADHGRVEKRRHCVCHDVSWMWSDRRYSDEPRFPNLAMIETKVERGGKVETEKRYYLSSARLDAETFAKSVRTHWHMENRQHWTLDVVFHDDLVRLRTGHGSEKMALIRHCSMNLLRKADDKHSLKVRRKKANLDPDYLGKLLTAARPLI